MEDYLISIVIPVYNEEKQIRESIKTIDDILTKHSIRHDFILVDDGSRDKSWQSIKSLMAEYPIHGIKLSRNFGKEAALCAGLEAVTGDACVVMDADLQHPPEIIPEMVRLWRNEGYKIIDGVKEFRGKESFIDKLSARAFYKLLKRLSGIDLNDASDFKLLDNMVVTAWRQMGERNTFFRAMAAWVGFSRTSILFSVPERITGKSRWSKLRLFKLAITAITSFSSVPLQLVTFLGVAFFLGSILLGIETIYIYFSGDSVSGFTTVILLLLIVGSILMISLGIIGTYIAKIFDEVKFRPRYIVSECLIPQNKVIKTGNQEAAIAHEA
jgi:glycosyltransferase involved in cell wall biosynthesis